MCKNTLLWSLTVLLLVTLAVPVAWAQSPTVDWWVIAGGGGPSTGGTVALNDTLGQPIIGPSSGSGQLSLGAGYWYGSAPPTAVTLHSFAATPQNQAIVLTWETALEVGVLGFHVYRADAADAEPVRLTPVLLPATGGPAYAYVDETAALGVAYTYWLEVVDAGGESTRYGPVSATLPPTAPHHIYLPLVVRE